MNIHQFYVFLGSQIVQVVTGEVAARKVSAQCLAQGIEHDLVVTRAYCEDFVPWAARVIDAHRDIGADAY